jgi:hypothetical protein
MPSRIEPERVSAGNFSENAVLFASPFAIAERCCRGQNSRVLAPRHTHLLRGMYRAVRRGLGELA